MSRYPFRNLVFAGGGVRSFVYHGALYMLEEAGVLDNIDRVAGTSAGAMLAALVALRLPVEDTLAIYSTIDMQRVAQRRREEAGAFLPSWFPSFDPLTSRLHNVSERAGAVGRLFSRYGYYATDYAYTWMANVMADHCDGNGRVTFAEFRALGYRDLHVFATNLSRHRAEHFSADTTPDVAVIDALLMSQAIPLLFEAVQFDGTARGQGDFYVDGGLVNNFPIELFDTPDFVHDPRHFIGGVNWETLGVRQYEGDDCKNRRRPISNLLAYMENMAEVLRRVQDLQFEKSPVNFRRTVNIHSLCVNATDFTVEPKPDNTMYQRLLNQGYYTTQEFLAQYQLPTPPSRLSRAAESVARRLGAWPDEFAHSAGRFLHRDWL